jgi:hypothetical protein
MAMMLGFLSMFGFVGFGFWTRKSPALVKPGSRAVGDCCLGDCRN